MSIYTGKCDVFDTFVMIYEITDFSNVHIYAANNDLIPLQINSQKDLIPYYPYLIVCMSSSKEGEINANLSDRSYIDIDEEERLKWRLDQLKKYYRRCKRNKEKFDDKKALQLICPWDNNEKNYGIELVKRVKFDGNKATYNGIHIPSLDVSRKKLFDDMVDSGYDELKAWAWCFGWERLGELDGNNNNKK